MIKSPKTVVIIALVGLVISLVIFVQGMIGSVYI
jgi:hypothetical protein